MVRIYFCLRIYSFGATCFAQELTPAKKTAISWVDGSKANFEEIAKYLWDIQN